MTSIYINFGSCWALLFLEASPEGQLSLLYSVISRTGFHNKPDPVSPFRKSPRVGSPQSFWGWSLWVGRGGGDRSLNSLASEFRGAGSRPFHERQPALRPQDPAPFCQVALRQHQSHLSNMLRPSGTSDQCVDTMCFPGRLLSLSEQEEVVVPLSPGWLDSFCFFQKATEPKILD